MVKLVVLLFYRKGTFLFKEAGYMMFKYSPEDERKLRQLAESKGVLMAAFLHMFIILTFGFILGLTVAFYWR